MASSHSGMYFKRETQICVKKIIVPQVHLNMLTYKCSYTFCLDAEIEMCNMLEMCKILEKGGCGRWKIQFLILHFKFVLGSVKAEYLIQMIFFVFLCICMCVCLAGSVIMYDGSAVTVVVHCCGQIRERNNAQTEGRKNAWGKRQKKQATLGTIRKNSVRIL